MIDWKRIDFLREEVGDEALPEVVALFLEETGEAVDGLRAIVSGAAAPAAPPGMAARMHFLAGSAGQLGLTRMRALAASAEDAARDGRAIDPAPVVDAYDVARAELVAGLGAT